MCVDVGGGVSGLGSRVADATVLRLEGDEMSAGDWALGAPGLSAPDSGLSAPDAGDLPEDGMILGLD